MCDDDESFHPTQLRINKNRPTLVDDARNLIQKQFWASNVDSYLYCYWCWLEDIKTITPFVTDREMFKRSYRVKQNFSLHCFYNNVCRSYCFQLASYSIHHQPVIMYGT